jgi:hypothetical protein
LNLARDHATSSTNRRRPHAEKQPDCLTNCQKRKVRVT